MVRSAADAFSSICDAINKLIYTNDVGVGEIVVNKDNKLTKELGVRQLRRLTSP